MPPLRIPHCWESLSSRLTGCIRQPKIPPWRRHPIPVSAPRGCGTLAAEPDGDQILIHDPHRLGQPIRVTPLGLEIVKHFSGEFTLAQIQESVTRITGGYKVELQVLANLTATLEESLLLDTPAFRERIGGPIRQPSCIGSYHADPKKLRKQLRRTVHGHRRPRRTE